MVETDNGTPYFLNLHNGEVAHTLILGMTGSGKSYLCNFLLQNAQKYQPLTFIFDIGGSFQSLTTIFGGSYLNVGQESRDFTINPFSLPPTEENLQFLFCFFRVLIEGNDAALPARFQGGAQALGRDRAHLRSGARTAHDLELRQHHRRAERPPASLDRGGQYGFLFDNAEDTLSFSQFPDLQLRTAGDDAPRFWSRCCFTSCTGRATKSPIPRSSATFKVFLLDEAWLFIRNETIRNYVVQAQKTWRKHNAAMILATQSIKELEESGMLHIVAESCPTKIFLANPEMDRDALPRGVPPERHRA